MGAIDLVGNPPHYTGHPSGIQPILFCRELPFDLGNVLKYGWRFEGKEPVRSLKSALWYFEDHLNTVGKSFVRVKWSPFLHQQFDLVVEQEPSPDKAYFFMSFYNYITLPSVVTAGRVQDALKLLIARQQ